MKRRFKTMRRWKVVRFLGAVGVGIAIMAIIGIAGTSDFERFGGEMHSNLFYIKNIVLWGAIAYTSFLVNRFADSQVNIIWKGICRRYGYMVTSETK